jgi:hypothetical protein
MELSKVCTKCEAIKPLTQFHKAKDCKFGVRAHCKECLCRDARNAHHAKRDQKVQKMRERRASDPEAARAYHRDYYAKNTELRREYFRKWRQENGANYLASASRSHRKTYEQPQKRLEAAIRAGVSKKIVNARKSARTFKMLGYSSGDLTSHLERQFTSGMTWQNYGEWHVDHIVPLSSFKYTSSDCAEFRAAWALSNLRPLWKTQNIKKGAKRLTLL